VPIRTVSRVLALVCILASTPVCFLKYPWLPATVIEYAELQHDPAPWGTPSYHAARAERLSRVRIALLLYGLGTVALCGLVGVLVKALPWWAELSSWVVTAVTGVGIASFERPNAAPGTNAFYVLVTIYFPVGIAAAAVVGAVVSIGSVLRLKRAAVTDG